MIPYGGLASRVRRRTKQCLLSFILMFSVFPPNAYADSDAERLLQAAGQLLSASQYLWHLRGTECGHLVVGEFGVSPAFEAIKPQLRAGDIDGVLDYLASAEWQIKSQNLQFMVLGALTELKEKGLDKAARCERLHNLLTGLYRQAEQSWEFAKTNFSMAGAQ